MSSYNKEDVVREILKLERELGDMCPNIAVTEYSDTTNYYGKLQALSELKSVKKIVV